MALCTVKKMTKSEDAENLRNRIKNLKFITDT